MKIKDIAAIICLFALMTFMPCAFADSILVTTDSYESGTGFGNIANLLTLQANDSESGSVGPPGKTLTGDAKNTSRTYTVAQLTALGLDADNLALVFNINETGGGDPVTLDWFRLDLYNGTWAPIGLINTDESWAPVSGSGTGTAGWIMRIQQGGSGGSLSDFFLNPDNILGASAELSDSWAGPENFYLVRDLSTGEAPTIPEPTTLLLLGTGLGILWLSTDRRRRK